MLTENHPEKIGFLHGLILATIATAFLQSVAWASTDEEDELLRGTPGLDRELAQTVKMDPLPKPPFLPVTGKTYTTRRYEIRTGKSRLERPRVSTTDYLAAREAFLAERRDQAIKLLRQEMDTGMGKNKDNILLRLGQLYAEKYMELSFLENEVYSKQLADWEKTTKANNKDAPPPKQDNSRSQAYLRDALRIFYELERSYPRHPKIDEILFFIGFVETENNRQAKGVSYLERVVRNYPRSRKFEEATVYLADHYFEKQLFPLAAGKYRILLSRPQSDLYPYAQYKLAWCDLNVGRGRAGLESLKDLIRKLEGSTDKAKFNLRNQALKDLVVFFAQSEAVDEAFEYYMRTLNKEQAYETLKLLADMLRSQAKDLAAVKAYERLLEEYPNSLDAPTMLVGIFESLMRLGKTEAAVDMLVRTLGRYGQSSEWARSNGKEKPKEVESRLNQLQAEAERAALTLHQSAQKSQEKRSYDLALRLYDALLAAFPNHVSKKTIAYYRGDILYLRGRYLEAATSYLEAAKVPPKDKKTDEAVYAALQVLDRETVQSKSITRFTKDQQKNMSLEPGKIPAEEQRFIEVAEYYIKEYPDGQRVVDVRFRIAAIHYRHRHFDVALREFNEIATKHPRHPMAPLAAHLVLDVLNIQKKYPELKGAAARFARADGLGDAKFKEEMRQIVSEVDFKQIETLEKSNEWEKAGDSYMAVYTANPNGPLAEKALYNAYISFEKAHNGAKAREASTLFIAKFPKSQYAARFLLGLAKSAEKQYDFDGAQRQYADFYRRFPQHKEARKALFNAAVYAELTEKNSEALRLYNEYLRGPVTEEERTQIQLSQAKLHRKLNELGKMGLVLRRLARDAKTPAQRLTYLGELARQYELAGRATDKEQVLKEMRAIYAQARGTKIEGPGVAYLAEAEYRAVERARQDYYDTVLRFPPQDLVYLLQVKQRKLVRLGEAYDRVVEVGVPEWGVAALYEKSAAFDNFVQSFRSLQIPRQFKGNERKEVEASLKSIDEKLIKPLEQRALEVAQVCVERAAQFYVANQFASRCRERVKGGDSIAAIEPAGLIPQPRYWSTFPPGAEVVKR